jgi:hypothetical protein
MEEKQVHWSELFGNPLRHGMHPAMLLATGYKVKMMAKLKGESKKVAFPVTVLFDEEYVIAKISKMLEELQPQKYNDFQRLVSKGYERWNDKRKKESVQQSVLDR